MTIINDYAEWLRFTGKSESTQKAYLYTLNKFISFSDGKFDNVNVMRFLNNVKASRKGRAKFSDGNKDTSFNRHLCALKSFFKFLKKEYEIADFKIRARDSEITNPISKGEVGDILSVCYSPEDRVMIRLLYYCGLRLGELLNLRAKDILNGGYMEVETEKKRRVASKPDRIPLDDTTYTLLKQYIKVMRLRPNDKFFTCSRNKIYGNLHTLCGRAGVGYFKPHAFRHGRATDLAKDGMSILYISRLLRHEHTWTGAWTGFAPITDAYIHITPEELKKELEMISK